MHGQPSPALVARLVEDYVRAWNEPDAEARSALLAGCWGAEAVYLDPTVRTVGRQPLSDHIGARQAERPGARIEQVGELDHHHDALHFRWRLVAADGSPGRVCTDVGTVAPDGLLATITGFFHR